MAQPKKGKDDGVVEKTTENNRPSGGFGAVTRIKKTTVKRIIICSIKGNFLPNFGHKIYKCRSIYLWIKIVQHNDDTRKQHLMVIKSH